MIAKKGKKEQIVLNGFLSTLADITKVLAANDQLTGKLQVLLFKKRCSESRQDCCVGVRQIIVPDPSPQGLSSEWGLAEQRLRQWIRSCFLLAQKAGPYCWLPEQQPSLHG